MAPNLYQMLRDEDERIRRNFAKRQKELDGLHGLKWLLKNLEIHWWAWTTVPPDDHSGPWKQLGR